MDTGLKRPTRSMRLQALELLALADPVDKAARTRALYERRATLALDPAADLASDLPLPGRPPRPVLRHAKDVPTRTPYTLEGRAAMLHAVTHIEFNAIKSFIIKTTETLLKIPDGESLFVHPLQHHEAGGRRFA